MDDALTPEPQRETSARPSTPRLFVVLTNPAPGQEEEYNRWYTERHLPDVLRLEGVVTAQRFKLVDTKPSQQAPWSYLSLYEIEGDVDEFRQRLGETSGTDAMPRSDSLAPGAGAWHFEPITAKRTNPSAEDGAHEVSPEMTSAAGPTGDTSEELSGIARDAFPGGVTSSLQSWREHPVFVHRADGAHLYDVNGRRILDFMNGNYSLPFGHRHEPTLAAIHDQVDRGLSFQLTSDRAVVFAGLLKSKVPSFDQLRFTCSGTEATMFAIRLARAFTGRDRILRMEGSYHGTHDALCIGDARLSAVPRPNVSTHLPMSHGVPSGLADTVSLASFNDLETCRAALEQHEGEFAAVLVEPILGAGGNIPAAPGFLAGLRELCDEHDALLVFDEMISILVGPRGAQAEVGVLPDLTTTGKPIAGGMPIGAFGGRDEIMDLCARGEAGAKVVHTGSFAAHPVAMAAGIATLKSLTDEAFDRLEELGSRFGGALEQAGRDAGVPVQVTRWRHLLGIHITERAPTNYRDVMASDRARLGRIVDRMLVEGVYLPGGRASMSTAMTDSDLERATGAFAVALHAG